MKKTEEADLIFGKVLRQCRLETGKSQERLAFDSGLGRVFISWLETGLRRPTLKTLISVSRGLGMPLSELILKFEAEYYETTKRFLHQSDQVDG